jgi:predicted amidophosphoribosyltransferase
LTATPRRPLCRYCRKRRPLVGPVCGDCREDVNRVRPAKVRNFARGGDAPATPPWVLERIEVYRARAAAMLPLFEGLAPGVG